MREERTGRHSSSVVDSNQPIRDWEHMTGFSHYAIDYILSGPTTLRAFHGGYSISSTIVEREFLRIPGTPTIN